MARSIYQLRQLPVAGESGFAAGTAAGSLVGVVPTVNLPSYSTYTPTWTSTGTAPAPGNAVVTARYIQVGKNVHAEGSIVFGNSSTFGTGTYSFALPVTAAAGISAATIAIPGVCYLFDSSTGNSLIAVANFSSSTTINILYPATYAGTNTGVGQLVPWTWALSDAIGWNITYEAA